MLDFDISRCSRKCSVSGRDLKPGEVVHSVLSQAGGDIVRQDFSTEAWDGPPDSCIGWWKTRIPVVSGSPHRMAPPTVMVQLFEQLSETTDQAALRFVLALLLIRKKLLREDPLADNASRQHWVLKCPLNGETYELDVVDVNKAQADELQRALVELLYGEAEGDTETEAQDSGSEAEDTNH